MKFSIYTFVTLFSCIFVTVQICHAQNLPQDYVNAHNAVRAGLGIQSIVWSTTLAAYAQTYANQRISTCTLQASGGPYGENIATGSAAMTGVVAVQMWASEVDYYTYDTNTCATGHICAHYTQVIWSASIQVGCARVQCNSGAYYVICSYAPKGNVSGQKPY